MPGKAILIGCLLAVFTGTEAQDTNYWNQQFGTRSALMGGAVIASSRDNSAIYYNPGLLGWVDTSSISISASAYQFDNITIKNALGQKVDFKSSHVGSVPLLLGGMIKTRNQKIKMAYGLMALSNFDFKANARIEGVFPLINDLESPGTERGIGQTSLEKKLTELGAGIGIGKKLSQYFSIGITGMVILRSTDYEKYSLTRVFMNQPGSPLITSTIIQNADYYNIRFQPKLGLSYERGNWQAGLAFTTPSLNIFGRGVITFDATATNISLPNQNGRINFIANDRQGKLKSTYKSPYSISGGIAYRHGRSHIELAMQYYGGVDMYSIINADSVAFARPANAYPEITSDKYLRILNSAKPVFNMAIAYEYQVKPTVAFYLSLRNNGTYYDQDLNDQTGIKSDISSWDIFHVVAGTTIQRTRSSLSVGITSAVGKDNRREQAGNINNDNESNLFQGTTTITTASYNSFGILLGYTYTIKKNQ